MDEESTAARRESAAAPENLDSAAAAEQVALRILGGAAQSAATLRRRLLRRGFTEDAAAAATAAMVGYGYIDDVALAQSIATRSQRTGHGRLQMAAQLRARGVADEAIASTLADVDADSERASALELGRRLWGRAHPGRSDRQRRERVAGALLRRGFDSETVYWVFRQVERKT